MGTKGADVTEVCDIGVKVEGGMKLNLDSPASQALSSLLPPWGGVGGKGNDWKALPEKRTSGRVSCLKSLDPTFSGKAGGRESVFTESLLWRQMMCWAFYPHLYPMPITT